MPKLYLPMLVKNEVKRYLPEIIDFYSKVVSGFIFLDNGSDDGTYEFVKNHSKTIASAQDASSFASHETLLRKKLMDLYLPILSPNDWVLVVDADELLERKFIHQVQSMMQTNINWYSFRFLHMWGSRDSYRIDGKWRPSDYGIRMFRHNPSHAYVWPNRPFACGSVPESILRLPGARSSLYIKHLGYANSADIPKKYELYSKGPAAPYHASAHVRSIVEKPTLAKWAENP